MVVHALVPATQEAEAEELLEPGPGRRRLQWAEVTPLHYSLRYREIPSQEKEKKKEDEKDEGEEEEKEGLKTKIMAMTRELILAIFLVCKAFSSLVHNLFLLKK